MSVVCGVGLYDSRSISVEPQELLVEQVREAVDGNGD
jgi:methionine synthase II (cobalamin-independent)